MQLFCDGERAQIERISAEILSRTLLVEAGVVGDLTNLARFECLTGVHGAPILEHFVQEGVIVVRQLRQHWNGVRFHIDHLHQHQCMMRGQRAPALTDEVRHRQIMFAAGLGDGVDNVVRVLLRRVVDTRLGGGIRAVVVHTEAATDIDIGDIDTHPAQLGIEARDFLEAGLDVADVRNLAAEMEVNELENIEPAHRLQPVDQLDELRHVETELALLSTALRPSTKSGGRKLDADTRGGNHAEFVRDLQQDIQLRELLQHDEDAMAKLLADERQTHELVVLVPVADNQMIRLVRQRDHGLQLRFRAALETDAVRLTELVDLLDDMALLIDLDREDRRVLPGVAVLLDRRLELLAELMHARAQQVREPQQHRHCDALRLEVLRQLEQIDLSVGVLAVGPHDDVALRVDIEIPAPPPFDIVKRAGVFDGPRRSGARGEVRRKRQGCHGAEF